MLRWDIREMQHLTDVFVMVADNLYANKSMPPAAPWRRLVL